jgi:DNA-binding response OmpR family regulator
MRLLIIEDETRIAGFLLKGLRAHGYAVEVARTGREGLRLADDADLDGVILDLGLPDIDGIEVLRQLRGRDKALPVLVLTARDQLRDKVQGLDLGADDYLTKPFAFDELLARLRARLRQRETAAEASVLRVGEVALDLHSRRARVGDQEVDLTAREFALLETFLRHPGQVLSREQLLNRVWGYAYDPESNVVDVYVRYLRRKLGDEVIQTIRGMGYRLTVQDPGR